MIDRKILARAEYTSLGLSALGTIVAITTGKLVYATSPLICSLFLNIINRNELARRTPRDIQNQITSVENSFADSNNILKRQIISLEKIANDRKDVEDIKYDLKNLKESMKQLQNSNYSDSFRGLIALCQDNINTIEKNINEVKLDINQSIKQQELNKKLSGLYLYIEKTISKIELKANNFVSHEDIKSIIIETFKESDSNLIESVNQQFKYLEKQIEEDKRLGREYLKESIQKNKLLKETISKVEKTNSFHQQIKEELKIIESIEEANFVSREELKTEINKSQKQICDFINQKSIDFNSAISNSRPTYNLVYDRNGSRNVLLETLENAQERIILVCPWITEYGANHELKNGSKGIVIELCEKFLKRGGKLDIGWGHLKDINQTKHIPISCNDFLRIANDSNNSWAYNQLKKFIELEKQYPNLKLKLLGTHEKFLVCDRSFAMIGSHNFLTSNCHSSEREIGLRTNDKNIIDDLIDRFESGINLEYREEKDNDDGLDCLVSDLDGFNDFNTYEPVKDHNYYNCDPEELYEQPGYWADNQ